MSDQAEQLYDRAKAGDPAAASGLITLYYERIFAYFRRLSGNDEDAQDLTQKSFLKVWSSLRSYQKRSSFCTWIHGVAHHVYVDWRRSRDSSQWQSDDWWQTCMADGPNPFEDVAEKELAHRLYSLVEQLEEGNKQTVHLHYYQGLSLKDTAEVLGVATSTVKYRLREALNFLRSQTAEPKFRT